jgi:hypothetical protein
MAALGKTWKAMMMKRILPFICVVSLLASTGCVFSRDHDHGDGRDHHSPAVNDDHSAGVSHWEDPDNSAHDANR